MSITYSLILALLFGIPATAQDKQVEFCSSRTTEAYHSPKCDWYVVRDPQRVADVKIPHKPPYHTYSRWVFAGRKYVFAYRDIDYQPEDMVADIYLTRDTGYQRVGSLRITGLVTDVSTASLTEGPSPDVIFRFACGQLQCLNVLRFSSNGAARKVFWYGASTIEILSEPKPTIVAKSKLANVVEEFVWEPETNKFRKVSQHVWQKSQ